MATLKEVARAAKVGTTTASVILNTPEAAGRFSESTIARVRQVAQELDYHPNHRARAFRGGRSQTVGLVLESDSDENLLSQEHWNTMIGGVHRALQRSAYQLTLLTTFEGTRGFLIGLQQLRERRIDGLILSESIPLSQTHLLSQACGPIASINFPLAPPHLPNVSPMDDRGTRDAVACFVAHHHRHLLWLGPSAWFDSSSHIRHHVFHEACSQMAVQAHDCLFPYDTATGQRLRVSVVDLAQTALNRLLLSSPPPFTAILAYNEECAVGAYRALRTHARLVPSHVSVIAFDNQFGQHLDPPLSSIDLDGFAIGECAGNLILQLIQHFPNTPPGLSLRPSIPPRLRLRSSVGPAPS